MRNVLLTFSLLLFAGMSFGQIKVITSGDTGIGTSTPTEQLHVDGNALVENGALILKNSEKNGIIRGEGAQRISVLTAPDGASSRAFLGFWGDETHTDNPNPARAGEMVVHCNYMRVGTNKPVGGFAATDFAVEADGNTYAYGDIYANGVLVSSDKRLKNDIVEFKAGLNEVLEMAPKQYYYNGKGGTNTDRIHTGVIAQEFAEIVPEGVKEYKYNDDYNDVHEKYLAVDEGMIKFMLVNAIKEQQSMIETQNERIAELEAAIINLANGTATQAVEIRDSRLGQNAPNPFNQSTVISYTVPTKASTAVMQIFDLNGQLLKTVNVANGNGQLTINAGELAAGTYSYNLVVDGAIVDTKKMVLTK